MLSSIIVHIIELQKTRMRCSTSSEQINDRDFKWTNKWSKSWSRSWSRSYYFQKVKKKSSKETEGYV